jgi:membrane protein DedA with SNARE-associated domain
LVEISEIFPIPEELGYLSLFLVSFLGSAIVFLPVPYFVVLAAMGIDPIFDPFLLALIGGVGAAGGKMMIFYGSYYGRKILSDETKRKMLPLQRLVSRYGWLAAFIASATPVPDDLVYIPLGLAKYSPARFFGVTLAGKILLSLAIVIGARYFGLSVVEPYLETIPDTTTFYVYFAIFAAVLTLVIIYTLRIDWSKNIGKWFPWTMRNEGNEGKDGKNDDEGKDGKNDDEGKDGKNDDEGKGRT